MTPSMLLSVLLCLTTLPVVLCTCDDTTCQQTCVKSTPCSTKFDCGKATQSCKQICAGPAACGTLTCSDKQASCKQTCANCPKTTTLTCSSKICEQLCEGPNCNMECAKNVKTCKQTCSPGSTCRMVCHDSTDCQRSCDKTSTCTYPASQPPTPSPVTTQCNQSSCMVKCETNCKGQNLSCPATDKIKTCNLMSKDGGNLDCGSTFDKCTVNCTDGAVKCKTSCKAKSCIMYRNGKFMPPVSAAKTIVHISNLCAFLVVLASHW